MLIICCLLVIMDGWILLQKSDYKAGWRQLQVCIYLILDQWSNNEISISASRHHHSLHFRSSRFSIPSIRLLNVDQNHCNRKSVRK